MRHEVIQQVLNHGLPADADSESIALATVRSLTLLFAVLKPLVGDLAVQALYARSLKVARPSFHRPAEAGPRPDGDWLAPLHIELCSWSPADAWLASQALLLSLVDLLASLIGDSLTDRLLQRAWFNSRPEATTKEKS